MKLLTRITAVCVFSLPLVACETMQGLFGDSNPHSRDNSRYQSPNNYPNRPIKAVSTDPNYHPEVVTKANSQRNVKHKTDVNMVDHGSSTAVNPKPEATGKGVVTHEGPMVPGGAPSVQ